MSRISNCFFYKYLVAEVHKLLVRINPRIEMNRYYRSVFGRNVCFEYPQDLIEKIYWLQLYSDTSQWTTCADKYLVRRYVIEKGFGDYLPTLLGKWDNADDITFDDFPSEFVLKTNNGCAQNIIVRDKTKVDLSAIRNTFRKWLRIPYGYSGAELHYTRIKPCIIAEEFLKQSANDEVLSPSSLIDYKVWCFNGQPESIFVAYNRRNGSYINIALFDTEWNSMSHFLKDTHYDKYDPNVSIPKPKCLDELLSVAKSLSSPFPEVRVDFYIINDKPFFGEMTFTTGYGYFTDDYYRYLGTKINLSKINKIYTL